MCTVSWLHEDGGYQLLCNRDEKLTRKPARGPRLEDRDGVRVLLPRDLDAGGSWLGVNEAGLTLCLLNGPPAGSVPTRSRGLLIPELLSAPDCAAVDRRLRDFNLRAFAPWVLLALEPGQPAYVAEWNGRELAANWGGEALIPLVSSSVDSDGVRSMRRREFARRKAQAGAITPAMLFAFHSSHGTRASAYSSCMHRPDAETVSFSWVRVNPAEIQFSYWPQAPCQWVPGERQRLERKAA
ncbi:MAG: NRDE family protein [Acidobacteria bacterium]|nr:NRDE family protein [Acidobacteriota bacterium]